MPKRIKKKATRKNKSRPKDINQLAHTLVNLSTEDDTPKPASATPDEISRVMAELGRRGGIESGKKRKDMPKDVLSSIASLAAKARWAKHKAAKQQ
jgi:hypothetical protein